jgi:hypothetical protein
MWPSSIIVTFPPYIGGVVVVGSDKLYVLQSMAKIGALINGCIDMGVATPESSVARISFLTVLVLR